MSWALAHLVVVFTSGLRNGRVCESNRHWKRYARRSNNTLVGDATDRATAAFKVLDGAVT